MNLKYILKLMTVNYSSHLKKKKTHLNLEISNESSAYHDNYVIKYYLHSFFITLANKNRTTLEI